jgi:hypothetical protein
MIGIQNFVFFHYFPNLYHYSINRIPSLNKNPFHSISYFYFYFYLKNSISQADLLITKYLLIANNISSIELCNNIIDDLFKASPRELPYIFRAIGVLLRQTEVNFYFVVKKLVNIIFIDNN